MIVSLKRRPVIILLVPLALTLIAFYLHQQPGATEWAKSVASSTFKNNHGDTVVEFSGETGDAEVLDSDTGVDRVDAENDSGAENVPGSGSSSTSPPGKGGHAAEGQLPMSGAVANSAIEGYMREYLKSRTSTYDAKLHLEKYGLKLGDPDLTNYLAELLDVYNQFFGVSEETGQVFSFLAPVLARMGLHPPQAKLPPLVKQVAATEKNLDKIPEYFDDWDEMMPNWNITLFDDTSLEQWVNFEFAGSEVERIFNRLPRQVLKSDLFRYLYLMVSGGIYTDSDTAPVLPAEQWGMPYEDRTPEIMKHLSRLLTLSDGATADVFNHPLVDEGGDLGEPALVVGIEFDAIMYGWDWTQIGVSRAVQITQWTMMARPGHPVFLDVVGRALRKTLQIEEARAKAAAAGEEYVDEWALEWTGPGVWTDCVYRYLLARYGFQPEQLIRIDKPIRVGDVLILPSKTFAAAEHKVSEKNRAYSAVFHGFNGRWRGEDPTVKKINELKKEKEEKEKAEKEAAEAREKAEAEAKVKAEKDAADAAAKAAQVVKEEPAASWEDAKEDEAEAKQLEQSSHHQAVAR